MGRLREPPRVALALTAPGLQTLPIDKPLSLYSQVPSLSRVIALISGSVGFLRGRQGAGRGRHRGCALCPLLSK